MKQTTEALAKAASRDQRPAFTLALMTAEEVCHQYQRMRLGRLLSVYSLIVQAIAVTHDIAAATTLYFGYSTVASLPLTADQVDSLVTDSKAVLASLSSIPTDKQGRVTLPHISRTLAQLRCSND